MTDLRQELGIGAYCLLAACISFVLVFAEQEDLLLYISYGVPLALILLLGSIVFVVTRPRTAVTRVSFAVATLAMLITVGACRYWPSTARKKFFLASCEIQRDWDAGQVRAKLRSFDAKPFDSHYPDSLTFFFHAGPGTVDSALVRFVDGRVGSVEYSPD